MADKLIRNCEFKFKCGQRWEEMIETEDDDIKFCDHCQKEVHLCLDDDELAEAMQKNWCVSLFQEDDENKLVRLVGDVELKYFIEPKTSK